MTYLKIWIHFVFSTQNHKKLLHGDVRLQLVKYMREMTREQKIYLDHLSVMEEHMHCLVSLGKEQTISQVARIISDQTANWLNDNGLVSETLSWDDYFAVSVSESMAEDVKRYIRTQEKYHQHKSFEEELKEFFRRNGWRKPSDKPKKEKENDQVADPLDFSNLELK